MLGTADPAVLVGVCLLGGVLVGGLVAVLIVLDLRRPRHATAGWTRESAGLTCADTAFNHVALALLQSLQPGRALAVFAVGDPPELFATRSARFAARAAWELARHETWRRGMPAIGAGSLVVPITSSDGASVCGCVVFEGPAGLAQDDRFFLGILASALARQAELRGSGDATASVPVDA